MNTDYIKKSQFKKNFWKDYKKILKNEEIKTLDDCNFKYFIKFIENKPKIEKNEEEMYKIAYIDGKPTTVGNFRIEPPGIFLGRGNHPKLGKIKFRIYPEDVTLNLDKLSPIPKTLEGHKWGEIIHDRTVEWLASWKDNISGKNKYIWLGNDSELKMKSDIEKFDLARKLKKKINTIRKENNNNLLSSNETIKQLATSLYLIDTLALRVGNEKSEDESDTVGVTSLRVEHVTLLDNNKIKLDFLGKDSLYQRFSINYTIQIADEKCVTSWYSDDDLKHYPIDFLKGHSRECEGFNPKNHTPLKSMIAKPGECILFNTDLFHDWDNSQSDNYRIILTLRIKQPCVGQTYFEDAKKIIFGV